MNLRSTRKAKAAAADFFKKVLHGHGRRERSSSTSPSRGAKAGPSSPRKQDQTSKKSSSSSPRRASPARSQESESRNTGSKGRQSPGRSVPSAEQLAQSPHKAAQSTSKAPHSPSRATLSKGKGGNAMGKTSQQPGGPAKEKLSDKTEEANKKCVTRMKEDTIKGPRSKEGTLTVCRKRSTLTGAGHHVKCETVEPSHEIDDEGECSNVSTHKGSQVLKYLLHTKAVPTSSSRTGIAGSFVENKNEDVEFTKSSASNRQSPVASKSPDKSDSPTEKFTAIMSELSKPVGHVMQPDEKLSPKQSTQVKVVSPPESGSADSKYTISVVLKRLLLKKIGDKSGIPTADDLGENIQCEPPVSLPKVEDNGEDDAVKINFAHEESMVELDCRHPSDVVTQKNFFNIFGLVKKSEVQNEKDKGHRLHRLAGGKLRRNLKPKTFPEMIHQSLAGNYLYGSDDSDFDGRNSPSVFTGQKLKLLRADSPRSRSSSPRVPACDSPTTPQKLPLKVDPRKSLLASDKRAKKKREWLLMSQCKKRKRLVLDNPPTSVVSDKKKPSVPVASTSKNEDNGARRSARHQGGQRKQWGHLLRANPDEFEQPSQLEVLESMNKKKKSGLTSEGSKELDKRKDKGKSYKHMGAYERDNAKKGLDSPVKRKRFIEPADVSSGPKKKKKKLKKMIAGDIEGDKKLFASPKKKVNMSANMLAQASELLPGLRPELASEILAATQKYSAATEIKFEENVEGKNSKGNEHFTSNKNYSAVLDEEDGVPVISGEEPLNSESLECLIPHMCRVCWVNDHLYCKNMTLFSRDLQPLAGCLHYRLCSHYADLNENQLPRGVRSLGGQSIFMKYTSELNSGLENNIKSTRFSIKGSNIKSEIPLLKDPPTCRDDLLCHEKMPDYDLSPVRTPVGTEVLQASLAARAAQIMSSLSNMSDKEEQQEKAADTQMEVSDVEDENTTVEVEDYAAEEIFGHLDQASSEVPLFGVKSEPDPRVIYNRDALGRPRRRMPNTGKRFWDWAKMALLQREQQLSEEAAKVLAMGKGPLASEAVDTPETKSSQNRVSTPVKCESPSVSSAATSRIKIRIVPAAAAEANPELIKQKNPEQKVVKVKIQRVDPNKVVISKVGDTQEIKEEQSSSKTSCMVMSPQKGTGTKSSGNPWNTVQIQGELFRSQDKLLEQVIAREAAKFVTQPNRDTQVVTVTLETENASGKSDQTSDKDDTSGNSDIQTENKDIKIEESSENQKQENIKDVTDGINVSKVQETSSIEIDTSSLLCDSNTLQETVIMGQKAESNEEVPDMCSSQESGYASFQGSQEVNMADSTPYQCEVSMEHQYSAPCTGPLSENQMISSSHSCSMEDSKDDEFPARTENKVVDMKGVDTSADTSHIFETEQISSHPDPEQVTSLDCTDTSEICTSANVITDVNSVLAAEIEGSVCKEDEKLNLPEMVVSENLLLDNVVDESQPSSFGQSEEIPMNPVTLPQTSVPPQPVNIGSVQLVTPLNVAVASSLGSTAPVLSGPSVNLTIPSPVSLTTNVTAQPILFTTTGATGSGNVAQTGFGQTPQIIQLSPQIISSALGGSLLTLPSVNLLPQVVSAPVVTPLAPAGVSTALPSAVTTLVSSTEQASVAAPIFTTTVSSTSMASLSTPATVKLVAQAGGEKVPIKVQVPKESQSMVSTVPLMAKKQAVMAHNTRSRGTLIPAGKIAISSQGSGQNVKSKSITLKPHQPSVGQGGSRPPTVAQQLAEQGKLKTLQQTTDLNSGVVKGCKTILKSVPQQLKKINVPASVTSLFQNLPEHVKTVKTDMKSKTGQQLTFHQVVLAPGGLKMTSSAKPVVTPKVEITKTQQQKNAAVKVLVPQVILTSGQTIPRVKPKISSTKSSVKLVSKEVSGKPQYTLIPAGTVTKVPSLSKQPIAYTNSGATCKNLATQSRNISVPSTKPSSSPVPLPADITDLLENYNDEMNLLPLSDVDGNEMLLDDGSVVPPAMSSPLVLEDSASLPLVENEFSLGDGTSNNQGISSNIATTSEVVPPGGSIADSAKPLSSTSIVTTSTGNADQIVKTLSALQGSNLIVSSASQSRISQLHLPANTVEAGSVPLRTIAPGSLPVRTVTAGSLPVSTVEAGSSQLGKVVVLSSQAVTEPLTSQSLSLPDEKKLKSIGASEPISVNSLEGAVPEELAKNAVSMDDGSQVITFSTKEIRERNPKLLSYIKNVGLVDVIRSKLEAEQKSIKNLMKNSEQKVADLREKQEHLKISFGLLKKERKTLDLHLRGCLNGINRVTTELDHLEELKKTHMDDTTQLKLQIDCCTSTLEQMANFKTDPVAGSSGT